MSTITRPLIDIYEFLDKKIVTSKEKSDYKFFGKKSIAQKCKIAVRFHKPKNEGDKPHIEVKDEIKHLKRWDKVRTSAPFPLPFCDTLSYFTDEKRFGIMKEYCERVFVGDDVPECVRVWVSLLPKFKEELERLTDKNKNPFVAFYYGNEGVPLTQMEEVETYFSKNDYAIWKKWFCPENETAPSGVTDDRVWYDCVDDKPLKWNEVYVGHMGISGISGNAVYLVSYNNTKDDTSDVEGGGYNYPISIEHGEMKDCALSWLVKPPTEEGRSNFIFRNGDRVYLWFPIMDEDPFTDIDDFMDAVAFMPDVFKCLFDGKLPTGITLDNDGNVIDICSDSDVPKNWLTDNGINLYELVVNSARLSVVERPFSVERMIKNIYKYEQKTKAFGGDSDHLSKLWKVVKCLCGGNDTVVKRIYNEYLKNVVHRNKPVSKEFLHLLRQGVMFKKNELSKVKGCKAFDVINIELSKASGYESKEELLNDSHFKVGQWVEKMRWNQDSNNLPTTFGGDLCESLYNGKTTVSKEIELYLTLDKDKEELRKKEFAKGIEVRETKYYTPKDKFGVSFHALANRLWGSDKYKMLMGGLVNTAKMFKSVQPICSDKEKTAFICGILTKTLDSSVKN